MKTFQELADEWLNFDGIAKFSRDKNVVRDFAAFLDGLQRSAPVPLPAGAQLGVSASQSQHCDDKAATDPGTPVADNGGDVLP